MAKVAGQLHKMHVENFFSRGERRCLLLVNKVVTSVTHCSKYKYKNIEEQSTQACRKSSVPRRPRGEREANFHALMRFVSFTYSAMKKDYPKRDYNT